MSLLAWIVFGITVGLIASVVLDRRNFDQTLQLIGVSIVGAIVGGMSVSLFERIGINSFSLIGVAFAILGAALGLLLYVKFQYDQAEIGK